jgi:hypothetical protein
MVDPSLLAIAAMALLSLAIASSASAEPKGSSKSTKTARPKSRLWRFELNVPGGLAGIVNCEEIKGSSFFEVIERAACKAVFKTKRPA